MLEDVLAELVYRRHQLGAVPEGLCIQLCQVQPAPSQGRRELIVLLFCQATDGTFPIVCDGRDVGGHIWVAALDAAVPFGALAESGCAPFLDGLPCPASPQLYPGAMVTLRSTHSAGRPNMMPVSAWWTVHPFSALISSPVPFPSVTAGSLGFQNAAIREAYNALLDVRIARGFALFEGRVAIFGPGSTLVFAAGQEEPTAARIASDLCVSPSHLWAWSGGVHEAALGKLCSLCVSSRFIEKRVLPVPSQPRRRVPPENCAHC